MHGLLLHIFGGSTKQCRQTFMSVSYNYYNEIHKRLFVIIPFKKILKFPWNLFTFRQKILHKFTISLILILINRYCHNILPGKNTRKSQMNPSNTFFCIFPQCEQSRRSCTKLKKKPAKNQIKKIREIDTLYLCLQQFDKF